jgi:hypothetical protein
MGRESGIVTTATIRWAASLRAGALPKNDRCVEGVLSVVWNAGVGYRRRVQVDIQNVEELPVPTVCILQRDALVIVDARAGGCDGATLGGRAILSAPKAATRITGTALLRNSLQAVFPADIPR